MKLSEMPTKALTDAMRSLSDRSKADGCPVAQMDIGIIETITDRLEALVRLTSEQAAAVERLRADLAVKVGVDPQQIVVDVEEMGTPSGSRDLDVAIIKTRGGHVLTVSDRWVDLWATEADFETHHRTRCIAVIRIPKNTP
jgi:hypothetical protein